MATKPGHNIRSSATKRILQEHREFLADPSPDFVAHPLEEDIFEWHVTVRGVENSEYAGGEQVSFSIHCLRGLGLITPFLPIVWIQRDIPSSYPLKEPVPDASA